MIRFCCRHIFFRDEDFLKLNNKLYEFFRRKPGWWFTACVELLSSNFIRIQQLFNNDLSSLKKLFSAYSFTDKKTKNGNCCMSRQEKREILADMSLFPTIIALIRIFQVQKRVSSRKMILSMVSEYWSSWKDIFIREKFKP